MTKIVFVMADHGFARARCDAVRGEGDLLLGKLGHVDNAAMRW
jgi:hypothetical protein